MLNNVINNLKIYFHPRLLTILFLGFSSGLPLLLISSTLQAWYTEAGVSIAAIGALSLVGQPYIYKFVWAPLMDRYTIPFLGRRRGWMFVTQIGLLLSLTTMAFYSPSEHPIKLACLALLVALFSASQDITINAYQTDILHTEERGPGAAMYVAGYRVAMLITGGIALIMAQYLGWQQTYLIMAALMFIGLLASLFGPELEFIEYIPERLYDAVVEPFKEFMTRKNAVLLLVFIIIYKISYALIQNMTQPFLLRDLGFSLVAVGTVNKGLGLLATIIGVFVGGSLTSRLGVFKSLLIFGAGQAAGNLSYMLLALVGKNYSLMVSAIVLENFFVGLETAAFVAFIMTMCDHRFTATQFALLSALASIARVFIGPLAAIMVNHWGWAGFYLAACLSAVPALILLWYLRKPIQHSVATKAVESS